MAKNERVSEETFGGAIPAPKMTGGKMPIFGHTIHSGQPIPDRGTSVNVKTGWPAKPVK
jgi:hypothetical protein